MWQQEEQFTLFELMHERVFIIYFMFYIGVKRNFILAVNQHSPKPQYCTVLN